MSAVWKTKFGPRRVKNDLPTIGEALVAAQDLSGDFEQQIEIAASLIGASVEAVRAEAAVLGFGAKRANVVSLPMRGPSARTVIVERMPSRRIPSRPTLAGSQGR